MDQPTSPEQLVVVLGPGGRTGSYIQVRTQPGAAMELNRAFASAGLDTSFSIQASAGVSDLVPLIVSIGTGLGGAAAVLSAWVRRHQDRAVLMQRDGTSFEVKGMSPAEVEDLIGRLLEKAAEDQRKTEHLYRGIPGADDEPRPQREAEFEADPEP